jgi:excisionase family DNA binding protein
MKLDGFVRISAISHSFALIVKEQRAMVRSRSQQHEIAQNRAETPVTIPEQLWDFKALQAYLNVGKDRVHWLIEKGLPRIRWGDNYRFHPQEVDKWVRSQQETETA